MALRKTADPITVNDLRKLLSQAPAAQADLSDPGDPLVHAYAQQALGIANRSLVTRTSQQQRQLICQAVAQAVFLYCYWIPTIHYSGDVDFSHAGLRRELRSKSPWALRRLRAWVPIHVPSIRSSLAVRSPLQQFFIWLMCRAARRGSAASAQAVGRWGEQRSAPCPLPWSHFVDPQHVSERTWDRWIAGAVRVPGDFLTDQQKNRLPMSRPGSIMQQNFDLLREWQMLWGAATRGQSMAIRKRMVGLFAGLMRIRYQGTVIRSGPSLT